MTTKVTIGPAGRLVIPKRIRDKLHLSAGDALELESVDEKIVLSPLRIVSPLRKENGMWVIRTGKPLAASVVDDVIRAIRDERDARNLGLS